MVIFPWVITYIVSVLFLYGSSPETWELTKYCFRSRGIGMTIWAEVLAMVVYGLLVLLIVQFPPQAEEVTLCSGIAASILSQLVVRDILFRKVLKTFRQ